ncbi:hypothetical protein GCM10023115_20070 [Pontixanthobacter gangjinensis]|uniref:Uncharacterized protein n=1 Tax=Pontixanthobacter gangjinensis TaxID=1028742 RepID=A0A6I4SN87_9SPHN|nr:hypothetical protein [Pontixanthobacter gangjinensis]MXO57255.1 hypothetical protein [Pontixanthobacter gangjinensis]
MCEKGSAMGADERGSRKSGSGWIVAGLVILFAGAFYLWVQSQGQNADVEVETTPPSSEWTSRPEGGVEVNLPEARMTNTPAEAAPVDAEPVEAE